MIKSVRIMPTYAPQRDEAVKPDTQRKLKKPPHYKVLLHNDNYTTMDFVVVILEDVFHKTPAEAYRIMMQVHTQGKGLCGMYPFEVAETKVTQVMDFSRKHQHPLQCVMEKK